MFTVAVRAADPSVAEARVAAIKVTLDEHPDDRPEIAVIAWPVGYYAAGKLFQDYAYGTEIGIVTFVLAGGAALAVVLLTVGRQALKAARVAPADSPRCE